ncbi:hypothetical protein HAX54_018962 [Datura stramonium]|uniref:Uncharacterized protein n=1 Tax=Datura stramonium TaxID=4076 RepID=A0ABS8UQ97_DATST|nr:hypothetical protein [Datura stramonium]
MAQASMQARQGKGVKLGNLKEKEKSGSEGTDLVQQSGSGKSELGQQSADSVQLQSAVRDQQVPSVAGKDQTTIALAQWTMMKETSDLIMKDSSPLSGKKSWANVMEEEADVALPMKKPSIWDDFDISKISSSGFKMEYVAPIMHEVVSGSEVKLVDNEEKTGRRGSSKARDSI